MKIDKVSYVANSGSEDHSNYNKGLYFTCDGGEEEGALDPLPVEIFSTNMTVQYETRTHLLLVSIASVSNTTLKIYERYLCPP